METFKSARKNIENIVFKLSDTLLQESKASRFSWRKWRKIKRNISTQIDSIDDTFFDELAQWQPNNKIKLLILAESPLTAEQYFYKDPSSKFLNFLESHYKPNIPESFKNNFKGFLRYKGIFVLDIYKYPVPAEIYKSAHRVLYNYEYFKDRYVSISIFIDSNTRAIYRYNNLRNRKLINVEALLINTGIIIHPFPLGTGTMGKTLNPAAIPILP